MLHKINIICINSLKVLVVTCECSTQIDQEFRGIVKASSQWFFLLGQRKSNIKTAIQQLSVSTICFIFFPLDDAVDEKSYLTDEKSVVIEIFEALWTEVCSFES